MNLNLDKIIFGIVVLLIVISAIATLSLDPGQFVPTLGMFVSAWLTLCILTFLYKDNPFYKAAEHVMVGLAMGFFTVYYVTQVLEPNFWNRLVYGELKDSDQLFGSADAFRYGLIIPAILGLLMLTRLSPKIGWLSRWSIATSIGIGSGLAIPTTLDARFMAQILAGVQLPMDYVTALRGSAAVLPGFTDVILWQVGVPIVIVGTVCALTYFFFSVPHRGPIGVSASIGIWVLMVGFGASFGYTVMARLSLFIGRVLFLLRDWLGLIT